MLRTTIARASSPLFAMPSSDFASKRSPLKP